MRYPIFTYADGTEVTASKPDVNGNIFLYIEKFSPEKDEFINATLVIPEVTIQSSTGYSDEELKQMLEEYAEIQQDIIEYVLEKEKKSA